jgi:DNA (cytosine-5)-methyltransferase 1
MSAVVLFGGIGGWELALRNNGIHTMATAEIDPWKQLVLAHHFPDTRIFNDVRDVTAQTITSPVDIVVGSPPCKEISSARTASVRTGVDGPNSGLYFEAVRVVGELRPRWGCFENSDQLRTRGADRVIAGLEEAGYACWPVVVGAVHAGAPHRRLRSWLCFARSDVARTAPTTPADPQGVTGWQCTRQNVDQMAEAGGRLAADPGDGIELGRGSLGRRSGRPGSPEIPWADGPGEDGLVGHLRVADGIPAGLGRRARSAYGDAVVVPLVTALVAAMVGTFGVAS